MEKKAQLEAAARQRAVAQAATAASESPSAAESAFAARPPRSSSSISSSEVSVKSEWTSNEMDSSGDPNQSESGLTFDSFPDDPFDDGSDIEFEMAPEIGSIGTTLNDDTPWLQ